MKKRILLSCIALCSAMLGAVAQRHYTFNATALNVDGLPNQVIDAVVTTVNLNPNGKNAAGATEFCNVLANSGWDIVGLSEDFNFHSYIAAAPASNYYNFGKHSGSISTSLSQAFTRAEIDGLGIAVAKHLSFTGDTQSGLQVQWEEEYGGSGLTSIGDNGADNMIAKGFRMYTVTLATGIAVDVYVLHMDAATADDDGDYDSNGRDRNVVAREAQLKQLADHIKNNHNNRPVIVLGDTNCRYTREQLKTGFIDYINADARFAIKDAWVELMWGGSYPTYNTGSIMTSEYGDQKGEIVDKVFYINTTKSNLTLKANSYLHDTSVQISDHFPVVVNFTITDPNGKAPTAAEKEESWTLEESVAGNTKPTWQGEQVVSGTTYYVMNVGTGTYIKWGGWWNCQAVSGYAGHPVTPTLNNGKYELMTVVAEGRSISAEENPYMDNQKHTTWTLTPVEGTSYQYYIEGGNGALTIVGDKNSADYKALKTVAKNASDETQKWIFLTKESMIEAMKQANADYPFNFTPLLGAADFDVYDDFGGYAKANWKNFEDNCVMNYVQWGSGMNKYNSSAAIVSNPNAVTLSQVITNMPAGNYKMSYEGFYNYIYNTTTKTITKTRTRTRTKSMFGSWSSWSGWSDYTTTESNPNSTSSEQTMTANVQLGSESATLPVNRSNGIADVVNASVLFRDNDEYYNTLQQTLSAIGNLTINVSKPITGTSKTDEVSNTSTSTNSSGTFTKTETETETTTINSTTQEYPYSVHFDNFHLTYYGTGEAPQDPYADFKAMVREKVNETYLEVIKLNAAGQAAYDITVVINRYNNDQITSGAIAETMCDLVDKAYANAYAAHMAYNVQQAIDQMAQNGGDITDAIINPSFETGDLTGWTVGEAWDLGAMSTSNGTYAAEGSDGNYLFNAYSGEHGHTTSVMQTIKGIPNGLYELKAMMTSHGATEAVDANNPKTQANRVYLVGNSYHTSIAAERNNKFEEATLYFLVEDGTAVIGAIGGNKGGGVDFIHYWPWEGCYFKADNFRLKRICDVPHGRLKLALNEAEAANLDVYGKAALNISTYQNAYTNKSLTTDGKAEAAAVRSALQVAAKAQRTKNADMTWAITNPSFETGDYTGWSTVARWDTGAREQANGTYSIAGTEGRYMFNTWNNAAGAEESGMNNPITQTVSGLPNGTYKVSAMVATDNGNSMNLKANGKTTTIAASTNGASSGVFPSVECEVTNGELTIEVVGVNNCWYKCDDFHLTLLNSELVLNETDKVAPTINGDVYSKVVVNRTIKPNTWSTFVVPFDIPADWLGGWDIKELAGSELNGETITLTFKAAEDGIKAGVPYMVRNTTMKENLTSLSMENVQVNTQFNNTKTDEVEFVGVYTQQFVPAGAFFISSNTFYQANEENKNTLKGFRAYIKVSGDLASKARSMSYRWDNEGTTNVDAAAEEVTTVAIYDINGVRLSEMQQGINILLMSDGSVVKILVK